MESEEVKEWMIFGRPFSDGLERTKFSYRSEYDTIDEAIISLDKVLLDYFYTLQKNVGDKTFALGLSGGWDSRLVLHYALRTSIRPKLFFMGNPSTNCYDAVKKICRTYHLEKPKIVSFHSMPNKELIVSDLKENKYGFYHIWRYHTREYDLPEHDILLSGLDGGESFGQSLPKKTEQVRQDSVWYLLEKIGKLSTLFYIPGVLTEQDTRIINKLFDYSHHFDNTIDMWQSFIYGFYSQNNKIFNSYSPFHFSDYRQEVRNWKPEWLKNLTFQKRFFNTIMPELAKIHSQKPYPPFCNYRFSEPSIIHKLYYKYMRLLRGTMTNYKSVVYNDTFKTFVNDVFSKPNEEFDEIFDRKKIKSYYSDFAHLNCKWFLNLIKIKIYFDEVKK